MQHIFVGVYFLLDRLEFVSDIKQRIISSHIKKTLWTSERLHWIQKKKEINAKNVKSN